MKTALEGSKGNFASNNNMTIPTPLFKKDGCEGHKGYLYMLKHEPPDDAQLNAFLHTWELEGDVKPFNDQFLQPLRLNLKQTLSLILEPRSIPKRTSIHAQVLLQWKEHPSDNTTSEAFQLHTSPNLSSNFSFVSKSCFLQLNSSPFQPQQVAAGNPFECEAESDFECSTDEGQNMETEFESSLPVSRSVVVNGLVRSTRRFADRSLSTRVTSKSVQNTQAEDRQPEYGYKEAQRDIPEQSKMMSNSTNVGRSKALEYKGRMGTFNPVLARELQFPTAFILSKGPVSEKKKTEVSFVQEVIDEIETAQVLTISLEIDAVVRQTEKKILVQWKDHPPDNATWEALQLQQLSNLSSRFSSVFPSNLLLASFLSQFQDTVARENFDVEADLEIEFELENRSLPKSSSALFLMHFKIDEEVLEVIEMKDKLSVPSKGFLVEEMIDESTQSIKFFNPKYLTVLNLVLEIKVIVHPGVKTVLMQGKYHPPDDANWEAIEDIVLCFPNFIREGTNVVEEGAMQRVIDGAIGSKDEERINLGKKLTVERELGRVGLVEDKSRLRNHYYWAVILQVDQH